MARATPDGPAEPRRRPRPVGRRSLAEVPPVYRSRLDPNRTVAGPAGRGQPRPASRPSSGPSTGSPGTRTPTAGGTAAPPGSRTGPSSGNDDSFTIHCPAGEVCFGECYYWEADTALTGLSLLAYLGAGYTHVDGKYAETVGQGLEFLRRSQKPDGDLRGPSQAVGMYCHAMATLALCEAYALTGDPELRDPVERAVGFLVRSRAARRPGLAVRARGPRSATRASSAGR